MAHVLQGPACTAAAWSCFGCFYLSPFSPPLLSNYTLWPANESFLVLLSEFLEATLLFFPLRLTCPVRLPA